MFQAGPPKGAVGPIGPAAEAVEPGMAMMSVKCSKNSSTSKPENAELQIFNPNEEKQEIVVAQRQQVTTGDQSDDTSLRCLSHAAMSNHKLRARIPKGTRRRT